MAEPASNAVGLIPSGLAAFAARVHTASRATAHLDLQYYIWRGDLTGRLLAREVLHAAERGVRVRLLLDDMYAIGRERFLSALDAHPRIEVRLFNATRWRRFGQIGFLLEMLFGGWHLNRRMHNKAWIADGQIAICGGRNIGDEYFDASDTFNFRDLDLAVIGPAAGAAQAIFDRYWNHPLARPVAGVSQISHRRHGGLRSLRRQLDQAVAMSEAQPFLKALDADVAADEILRGDPSGLTSVSAEDVRVVSDAPDKAAGLVPAAAWLTPAILDTLEGATAEALLISPYFVPGERGAALLEELVGRGVLVSVVTNSLAATDVVAVHGGYARYRKRLLRAGVTLHELRPSGEEGASILGSRGASLHTKALVVDGRCAVVGSFNLDPRSRTLNTEMGTFVHHPDVAQGVKQEHARLIEPERSWRVALDTAGRLTWTAVDRGGPVTQQREPSASLRRRLIAKFVQLLPLESQL